MRSCPTTASPRRIPGRIDINADHRFEPKGVQESDEARQAREAREQQMRALGYHRRCRTPSQPPAGAPEEKGGDWLHTQRHLASTPRWT